MSQIAIIRALEISLLLVLLSFIINFDLIKRGVIDITKDFKPAHLSWVLLFLGYLCLGEKSSLNLLKMKLVGTEIYQLVMMFLAGGIALSVYFKRIKSSPDILRLPIVMIILYATVGMISGFFATHGVLSAYKASLLMLDALVIALILSYEPRSYYVTKMINITYIFYILLVLAFALGAFVSPDKALHPINSIMGYQLYGVLPLLHPNTIGSMTAIACIILISRMLVAEKIRQKMLFLSLLLCSLVVLILAQSRTALISLLVGLPLLLFLRKRFIILAFVLIIGTPLAIQHSFYIKEYYRRNASEDQLESWSGRKKAWEYSWKRLLECPVIGYGMASGVRFGDVMRGSKMRMGHMHNSYFEVLLNTGLLGFIPWLVCLISVSCAILRKLSLFLKSFEPRENMFDIELGVLVIMSLIRTLTGSIFVYHHYTFMLYGCFIAYSQLDREDRNYAPELES